MNTIRSYLDNMLAAYPQTPELLRMKEELLGTMEDKYNSLKAQGKSENEAVGIVISEFGNIDELMLELDMQPENINMLPAVDHELAVEFIEAKRRQGLLTALGVVLCFLGPTLFLVVSDSGAASRDLLAMTLLFLLVAAAVGMFIYAGFGMEKYKFLEGEIFVPADVTNYVRGEKERFTPRRNLRTLVGVLLIFCGPLSFLLLGELTSIGVFPFAAMLCLVAAGVFCLIISGNVMSAYNMLLQMEGYTPAEKKSGRTIGAVAAVWWPVCVVIYLLWSFISRDWHITWLIWPVSALLFGAFSGAYSIIKSGKQ